MRDDSDSLTEPPLTRCTRTANPICGGARLVDRGSVSTSACEG